MDNVTLYLGDCLDFMHTMPDKSVDVVITDPPYGIGKAEWDIIFPTEWYSIARIKANTVVTITGGAQLKYVIPMVGDDFVDVIAARNLNGMTFTPLGFGNWISAVIAGIKPKSGITFFEFVVNGDKPNHPSPKPIDYMRKLIGRVTDEGDTIFDPFMGSGTTGVACMQLGRNFIGCEIDPGYFKIARKRIEQAQMQLLLPLEA